MNTWKCAALLTANTLLATTCFADELEQRTYKREIPTAENAFVDVINMFDKTAIVEQLGEPATADDVRLKGTNKVVASIWHYHYINTADDGTYYPTTELDFIDDKVVQVVFLNNDGSESDAPGQTYELPDGMPIDKVPQLEPNI